MTPDPTPTPTAYGEWRVVDGELIDERTQRPAADNTETESDPAVPESTQRPPRRRSIED